MYNTFAMIIQWKVYEFPYSYTTLDILPNMFYISTNKNTYKYVHHNST